MSLRRFSLSVLLLLPMAAWAQLSVDDQYLAMAVQPPESLQIATSNIASIHPSTSLAAVRDVVTGDASRSQSPAYLVLNGSEALELGLAEVKIQKRGMSPVGKGVDFHVELGLCIQYGMLSDFRITALSIHLAYMYFDVSDSYTEGGAVYSNNLKFNYAGIPITYTSIYGANRNVGFFWQLGLNTQYNFSTVDGGSDVQHYKKVQFLPYASE